MFDAGDLVVRHFEAALASYKAQHNWPSSSGSQKQGPSTSSHQAGSYHLEHTAQPVAKRKPFVHHGYLAAKARQEADAARDVSTASFASAAGRQPRQQGQARKPALPDAHHKLEQAQAQSAATSSQAAQPVSWYWTLSAYPSTWQGFPPAPPGPPPPPPPFRDPAVQAMQPGQHSHHA